jgi:hypothetical protein
MPTDPNLYYRSAGWATEQETRTPRITRPIERDQAHLVITRFYQCPADGYAAGTLNTLDAEYNGTGGKPSAYLVENGPVESVDGNEVAYTRTFATIPADRDDYDTFAYSFPAQIDVNGITRRQNMTFAVTRRIANKYYLVGTGGSYATPNLIPTEARQRYILTYYPTVGTPAVADVDFVQNVNAFGVGTAPTLSDYLTYVSGGTEIKPEESHLEQYMGNIWRRYVGYIKAI